MTTISEIEQELSAAQERLKKATRALAPKHKGGELEEFGSAYTAVLSLERELAAAKGEEYAMPLEFPVKWSVGAPLPHIIRSDDKTFLTFYIDIPDPNWDGTCVTVKDPGDGSIESLALVEFYQCVSAKLGAPNDEVFSGHPLYGKGLEGYTAQVVQNSRWIAELEAINQVHDYYKPDFWRTLKHYVFWFHDSTFECIAKSYNVEIFHESMSDLLARVCKRLLT